jgi:hypothetical protein
MRRIMCFSESRGNATFLVLCFLVTLVFSACASHVLKGEHRLDLELIQLLQAAPSAESYPDADIIFLLDENIEEVLSDGSCKSTTHQVFKILRESGKEDADSQISYDSRTETLSMMYARTITPDGEIIPLKKNAMAVITPYSEFPDYSDYKELTFSMPGVEVGCIIDYKYVIEQKPIIEGEFASSFFVQWEDPVLLSRYKVITPDHMDLRYLLLNPLRDVPRSPDVIHSKGKKIYLWEHKNIPQVQVLDEEDIPPMEEIAFNIWVTTMDSWEPFFRWWRKQAEGKTEPNEAIKKKVAELIQDLPRARDRMEALFDYVKRTVRYVSIDLDQAGYVPESASEVFENKYGDCKDKSTLLISMLKEAGIAAYYVLIPTHDVANLVRDFPDPFQFDHCIVAAETKEGCQFLDPTAEDHPFDYLPDDDQNRGVVIFEDPEAVFSTTPLAEPEENTVCFRQEIEIGSDGAIRVNQSCSASGSKEATFRSLFIHSSPTEIRESLHQLISETSPKAELLSYTHSDPLDFKGPFVWEMTYTVSDYCVRAADLLIFPVPNIEAECLGADKEERQYATPYEPKSYSKKETQFSVPEGYEIYYLPEQVEMKNPYFEYYSGYRTEGRKILFQGELLRKAVQIPPGSYGEYRELCQAMVNSSKRYVVFAETKR